jgi:hypothetical protein
MPRQIRSSSITAPPDDSQVLAFVSRAQQLRLRGSRNYSRYMRITKGFVEPQGPERAQWRKEAAQESVRDAEWNRRHGPVPGGAAILLWRQQRDDASVLQVPAIPYELERIVSRCLRKDRERRFQNMSEVFLALEDLQEESQSSASTHSLTTARTSGRRAVLWALALAIFVAGGTGFVWWRGRPGPSSGAWQMTRATADSGWTTDPALSPDGKLLAYASDRATGENLDIWVQHLGSGEPVRLTGRDSDETEPDFSPDGSRIVFRSSRQSGGIYVTAVLGGEPQLVAPKGFRPRFSPDGNWIAYWVGTEGAFGIGTFGTTQVFVTPASGGAPKRLALDLTSASHPIWSPDGTRLIVAGRKDQVRD